MHLSIGVILAVCVILFAVSIILIEGLHAAKCAINDEEYSHSLKNVHKIIDKIGYPDMSSYLYKDFSDVVIIYGALGTITGFITIVLWPIAIMYFSVTQTVKHLRAIKRLKKELANKCEE